LGHSTWLVQVGGRNVLLDPVWGERASPVGFAGPRRWAAPGVAFERLPPIDLVVLSHDHYDHFDDATLRRLAREHPEAAWLAPLGVAARLRARGAARVAELDWWGEHAADGLRATCVPAQHFSGRTPFDRDSTLWCGWVLRAAEGGRAVWFVGDTGRHPEFGAIARRAGPFDLVLMPVGAYEPRWFMRPVHLDPEDAVAAYGEIAAACAEAHGGPPPLMAGMHWGTFKLTDEPIDEPPRRTAAAWKAAGLPTETLWMPAFGETRNL
jgi:N-acyl-phosphatidylethanolamine-hydrolysing phospholipase D